MLLRSTRRTADEAKKERVLKALTTSIIIYGELFASARKEISPQIYRELMEAEATIEMLAPPKIAKISGDLGSTVGKYRRLVADFRFSFGPRKSDYRQIPVQFEKIRAGRDELIDAIRKEYGMKGDMPDTHRVLSDIMGNGK